MLSHFNIERSNSQLESKAPFTFESTLEINGQKMPQGSFLSVKVYVDGSVVLPVRIYCVRQNGDVVFCDNRGTVVAIWKTHPVTASGIEFITSVLINSNGVLTGTLACTKQALNIIRGAINGRSSDLYLPSNAFVLIPQCHVSIMPGSVKAISVTDKEGTRHNFTADIELLPANGEAERSDMIFREGNTFNLRNTYETVIGRTKKNGICNIVVDGNTVDCSQSRLIIKAKMTYDRASNLRVIQEQKKLVLRGVKDV